MSGKSYKSTFSFLCELPTYGEHYFLDGPELVLEAVECRAHVHDERAHEDDPRQRVRGIAQNIDENKHHKLAVKDHEIPHLETTKHIATFSAGCGKTTPVETL